MIYPTRTIKKLLGWSLIELIAVLGIIAILAIIAIPKYLNMLSNARVSAINAAAGAMRQSASIVYAACQATPSCDVTIGPAAGNGLSNSIVMQGQSITLAYGYPRGTTAGIIRATSLENGLFEIVSGATGVIQVRSYGARLLGSCEVEYKQAASPSTPYTITVTTAGC